MIETEIPPRWFRRRPRLALVLVNLGVLALLAVGLELAFRLQLIDFWGAELRRYNPDRLSSSGLSSSSGGVLLLGDSFVAGRGALADQLRPRLAPQVVLINAGVSGTTARDAALMAPRRLARFRPTVTLYQVYVGNDLFETRHRADPNRSVWGRRLYWWLMDRGWWSLGWTNYKLGQGRDAALRLGYADLEGARRAAEVAESGRPFDPARYRGRDREFARTMPRSIADQVRVAGAMATAWRVYAADLERLAAAVARSGSTLVVVVVPHCVQVAPVYRERFVALGAELGDHEALAATPSEWVVRLRTLLPAAEVVDPLPAMRQAEASGVAIYQTHDPHLTRAGQELVAELLAAGPLAAARRHSSAAGTATTASVATVAHAAPRAP